MHIRYLVCRGYSLPAAGEKNVFSLAAPDRLDDIVARFRSPTPPAVDVVTPVVVVVSVDVVLSVPWVLALVLYPSCVYGQNLLLKIHAGENCE